MTRFLSYWRNFWTYTHWVSALLVLIASTWWWRTFWLKEISLPTWLMVESIHFYHFGYFGLVLLALLAWLLTGGRGLLSLAGDGVLWWLLLLWQLALWGRISFGADVRNHEVAIAESSEFIAVVFFLIAYVANPPPLRWVAWALAIGLLIQVAIGFGQVQVQHEINIKPLLELFNLKELHLDPAKSGVSVIGPDRYLRPYGLSAHPNLWVAGVIMGLFGTVAWWLERRRWAVAGIVTLLGWWGVMLSFSRAAVLGVGIGGAVCVGLWALIYWRAGQNLPSSTPVWRGLGYAVALALGISLIFVGVYDDLVLGRFIGTVTTENGQASTFENFSGASRAVYIEQALSLIPDHLWLGVGRGNFAWESAYLLYCCDSRDLRGDNVHNIYLLALVEVGIIGFGLFMLALVYGLGLILWRAGTGQLSFMQAALAGGVVAWLVIGWFDHYAWTQFGHQLLFWAVFASALGRKIQKPTLPT